MRAASTHRILIVDDDDDDRYIVDLSFRQIQWGDHIKLLSSGDDMFRHLDALGHPSSYPSLILLDYNMPQMGAEEILGRLKRHEQYNTIKVAVYSTGMTDLLSQRLKALGAMQCYNKLESLNTAMQLAVDLKAEAQKELPIT